MTEKFIKLSAKTNTAEVLEIPAVEDKELDNSFIFGIDEASEAKGGEER